MVLIDKNYHSDAGVLVDFDDDLKKENFMRSLFCDVVKFFAGYKKGTGILENKFQWSSPPLPFFQAKRVKVVTRLKDFSGRRRPVSLHSPA